MACGFLTIVAVEAWVLMEGMTDGRSMPVKTQHMVWHQERSQQTMTEQEITE
jgi:hypothetical protein